MEPGALGKEYDDQKVICRQGDRGDSMYVIQAGRVLVVQEEGDTDVRSHTQPERRADAVQAAPAVRGRGHGKTLLGVCHLILVSGTATLPDQQSTTADPLESRP